MNESQLMMITGEDPDGMIAKHLFNIDWNMNSLLKVYSMLEDDKKRFSRSFIKNLNTFLRERWKVKLGTPQIGLAIASEDLKIIKWNLEEESRPSLDNQLYEINGDPFSGEFHPDKFSPLGVIARSRFDVYELGIIDHERRALLKYLQSNRNGKARKEFLRDTFEGPCWTTKPDIDRAWNKLETPYD